MGHIYRLKTSYKNGKSRLILKSMNVKKYCFSTLLLIFLGITCSYAEPPVIKVGAGNGQGNTLNFTQFEPFVAEYSGFKTSGTNNDLWVGLIQDNTFIWTQDYKGNVNSKYTIEYGLKRPIPPGSYQLAWQDNLRNESGRKNIVIGSPPAPDSNTTWTVLIYGHGDSNLTLNLLEDINEMISAGGSDNFKIILQADFDASEKEAFQGSEYPVEYRDKVTRIVFDGNGVNFAEVLPEQDLDDPVVLADFLDWSLKNFPSERRGLVLWNHGGQWEGFGGDNQDGKGSQRGVSMWTSDIRDAIKTTLNSNNTSKYDFISFDTCLMGGAEQLVDFYDLCDIYIANPEIDYGDGWDYASTMAYLRSNPDLSMTEFAGVENGFWDFHHQQQSDKGFKVHVAYDMNVFAEYNQKMKAFTRGLVEAIQSGSIDLSSLARLRRESIPYSLTSPRVGKSTVTDYIDIGNFASELSSKVNGPMKSISMELVAAINNLIISKSLGTERQNAVGLSIYYPIDGKYSQIYSADNTWVIKGKEHRIRQNFLQDEFGGADWKTYLSAVQGLNISDVAPPVIQTPEPSSTVGLVEGPISEEIDENTDLVATGNEPAVLSFEVTEGDDAYSARAALVTNETFDNAEQYIFLGEIGSGILDGIGEYNFEWDAKMPMISLIDSQDQDPVFLGGYAWEPGSNIHISFADYLAPGAEDVDSLIVFTAFDEDGFGVVDTVLEDTIDTDGLEAFALSPREYARGFEPGGVIWPVYYTETFDNGEYYSGFSSFDEIKIIIPENGTDGLQVSRQKVDNGDYGVAVQTYDYFENESDLITFLVNVSDEKVVQKIPELSVTRQDQNIVISWSSSSEEFILQATNTLELADWENVDPDLVDEVDDQFVLSLSRDEYRSLFFRLSTTTP